MLYVTTIITRAISALRRGIDSGWRAVRDLRSNRSASSKLVESFVQIQDELKQFRQPGEDPNLYFIYEGRTKPLRAAVEQELYGIGREALINAFRHAHARNIEIAVVFHRNSLSLNIQDDGCGIEPKLVAVGNSEHLGLKGIREKAGRMGARLSIWSARGCGTALEVKVPGPVAFPGLEIGKS